MATINYSIVVRSAKPGTKKENVTSTKAYPQLQSKATVTMTELAEHIAEHGSKYNRGDIYAVLSMGVDCARELMLDGKRVQMGDLGTFYASAKVEGAETAAKCTSANIKDLKVSFRPGKRFCNLIDDADFELVPTRAAQADAVTAAKNQETIQDNSGQGGNGHGME